MIGYFVERQSNVSPRWVRINKVPVEKTELVVPDLNEGSQYEFRIIAVNKKGESKPSLPSDSFVAKNPFGMFTASLNCILCKLQSDFNSILCSIQWLVSSSV